VGRSPGAIAARYAPMFIAQAVRAFLLAKRHRHDLEGPPRQQLREPGIFPGFCWGTPQHGDRPSGYHEARNHQGRATSCYFLGSGTSIESGASNAAIGQAPALLSSRGHLPLGTLAGPPPRAHRASRPCAGMSSAPRSAKVRSIHRTGNGKVANRYADGSPPFRARVAEVAPSKCPLVALV
jgi:hypothetical protein